MDYFINYYLINFKNFANARIDLSKPLTVLIGKNGSGKTNFIEGIEVFAHLAQGTPLHKFGDVGKGGYCQVRGGLGNCARLGIADFELRFNAAVEPNVRSLPRQFVTDYKIKISDTGRNDSFLSAERLSTAVAPEKESGGLALFNARRSGDKLKVEYNDFTGDNPSVSLAADRSVMSRYEEILAVSTATNPRKTIAPYAVKSVSNYLKPAYVFDTNPKVMRNYERVTGPAVLSGDGSNLSAVLYRLKQNGNLDVLKRITKAIQLLPEEAFSKIHFIETSANDVMLGFYGGKDKTNKRLFDARVLSDGTLRMLAILTALETVQENSRIVLEEFDNGLHPSRAHLLIDYVHKTAVRRGLKVLVTTHNPAFMNALTEEQMESVFLCHRDPKTGHSNLTRLMSVQGADLMMLRGSLGDLVTDEIVEKYLSPEYREKRAELARKWKERYSL